MADIIRAFAWLVIYVFSLFTIGLLIDMAVPVCLHMVIWAYREWTKELEEK